MSDEPKPKEPRRVLPASVPGWATTAEPSVKQSILKRHLRQLAAWGCKLDDIYECWGK